MSVQGLQHVVCRGALDPGFMALFARAPHEAIAGLDLSAAERELLIDLQARTLTDLAAGVEAWRRGERDVRTTASLAVA